ncbi:MAG TPA: MCE family protein [Acidimicrobiales bacterium]|nr:MCE family protein [Acidimicrobiales bacterium]
MRRLRLVAGAVALAAGATGLAGCGGPGSVTYHAVVANGLGLFPGSNVQILGLKEGTVTGVANEGGHVLVTFSLPSSHKLPADVHANVFAPELLGQDSVDLEPGYTGGPTLAAGGTIPISRTSVPVQTNTILKELTDYLKSLNPQAVHDLVTNLDTDLAGQGQALNSLIHNAAGTISILASKGDQLGQLNGILAQLTGALDSRSSQIQTLITDYDGVSGVIAQDRNQLDGAIKALSDASTQLAGLLDPNLAPLKADVATLTTVGRTLDRNLTNLDTTLTQGANLFAGAARSYDPAHMWINLNLVNSPGITQLLLDDEMRDRLAGVCRRVLAHHSAGLSAAQKQTLSTCGDPASGFFDPIFGITNGATGAPTPPSASQSQNSFSQGLAAIPGLSPSQRTALANPTPTSTSTTSTTNPASLLPPLQPLPGSNSTQSGGGLLGGITGGLASFARSLWGWL